MKVGAVKVSVWAYNTCYKSFERLYRFKRPAFSGASGRGYFYRRLRSPEQEHRLASAVRYEFGIASSEFASGPLALHEYNQPEQRFSGL
jgi:hypothetical protein